MEKVKTLIKKPEIWIISFLFLFRIVYFWSLSITYTPDSYEYIARDGFAILHGTVDRYRLPGYPMLLDICKALGASNFDLLACLIQLFVSLISIVVFYLALTKLMNKKWICLSITVVYSTLNAVCGWDKTLLTESLSLSITVFILFGIISFLKDNKYRYVVLTTICLLFGCFLRAVFVIYAGLFFGFLIIKTIFPGKMEDVAIKRKARCKNLVCTLICSVTIILVLIYAAAFNIQYGGFTLSDSALGQQLTVVLQKDYYKDSSDAELKEVADSILNSTPRCKLEKDTGNFVNKLHLNNDEIDSIENKLTDLVFSYSKNNIMDPSFEKKLEESINEEYGNTYDCSFSFPAYLARLYIMENYDRDRVKSFVNESKHNNFKTYLYQLQFNLFDRFTSSNTIKENEAASYVNKILDNGLFSISISLLQSLIFSLLELVAFIYNLIKKKKFEWIRLGLGVFMLSTIVLSVVGTNDEFARTAITVLPFMFASIFLWIGCFSRITNIRLLNKNKINSE